MQDIELLYSKYKKVCGEVKNYEHAIMLLEWDQQVMAPKHGTFKRGETLATLAGARHEKILNELKPIVCELATIDNLPKEMAQNVQITYLEILKTEKLPTNLVSKLAQTQAEAINVWEKGIKEKKSADFLPKLKELIDLKRQEANYYGYEKEPYDALIDNYDRKLSAYKIDQILKPLVNELRIILQKINGCAPIDDSFIYQKISIEKQKKFCDTLARDLGFDFEKGRQDASTHPFTCSMSPNDVRITTHFDENNIFKAIYATIHECGHALYEQGLSDMGYGLPISEACSLSIHESQSRMWENNICHSFAFWEKYFDAFAQLFPDKLKGKTPLNVFKAANKISAGKIRIYADEVTYHFHIYLRFELERALINGELSVFDVEMAWNEKMKEYLGQNIENVTEGFMQDIHWASGLMGYFPTYSLGSLFASQFFEKIETLYPNSHQEILHGDFKNIHTFLKNNIYSLGKWNTSDEICYKTCGTILSPTPFINYISNKMKVVYGF